VIAPMETTTVELDATRCFGNPTSSIQTIHVVPPEAVPKNLAASIGDPATSAGCSDGKVWATIHPKNFAPELKVAMVSEHAGDSRSYEIKHAGVVGTVGPGTPSSAFASTLVLGDWLLTSPLSGQETCGSATVPAVLPRNLLVDVFIQCQPEAHP
jgi:hypothetical protein